jgi:hypothetical protein
MENFNIITLEKTSKYGQHYVEADIREFEKIKTKPRIIKTKDIIDVFLLSDYDLEGHKEEEVEWVNSMIKEGLNKYFYLKLNQTLLSCYGKQTDLILVFGDYLEFMPLIHTGGYF